VTEVQLWATTHVVITAVESGLFRRNRYSFGDWRAVSPVSMNSATRETRDSASSREQNSAVFHAAPSRQTIPPLKGKGKGFPYSIPSDGPGGDPGVQAVSPQVTVSHPPGGRLPLLSARLAVTSSAAEHHRPLAGTKLYCLVTEAHRCEQLA